MNVFEAIKQRKSVRKYTDEPVESAKLVRVLEAARLAPSASNRQEWRFVVVTDAKKRQALAQAANEQLWAASAPVFIACCAETDEHRMSCGQLCYPIDVAIAIDHMTLVAVEEALGTCWIGAFNEAAVKSLLKIPLGVRVVELLTLGYPQNSLSKEKKRHRFEEIVHFEHWQ